LLAITGNGKENRRRLKINAADFIYVWFDSEYFIIPMCYAVNAVKGRNIVINIHGFVFVLMTIDTKHKSGEERQVVSENLRDIVVELIAVWWGMHDENCPVKQAVVVVGLILYKIEVGHGSHAVIFHGIGVKADDF
jgi:hypothetical protein